MPTKTWSSPETALGSGGLDGATDDVITETYWDRAMSNLDWLAGTAGVINQASMVSGSTSSPTTTSASYVDATDLSVSVTPEVGSTRLFALALVTMSCSSAGASETLALSIDGGAEVGAVSRAPASANDQGVAACAYLFTGVSAAAHTVKARVATSAGTLTLSGTARHLIVFQLK